MLPWYRSSYYGTYSGSQFQPVLADTVLAIDSAMSCNVYIECVTGFGDLLFDTISGVVVAQRRGCVMPVKVHTHYYTEARSYLWNQILSSEMFVMQEMVRTPGLRQRKFPDVNASDPSNIMVTFMTDPTSFLRSHTEHELRMRPEFASCGAHTVSWWVRHLVPRDVPTEALYADAMRIARTVHIHHAALPLDIRDRVVVHVRRGDRLARLAQNRSEMLLLGVEYDAVARWLVHHKRKAYLVTDDPHWGLGYAERLVAAGVDVRHNLSSSHSTDDLVEAGASHLIETGASQRAATALAALMAGSRILRPGCMASQFSWLASVLSGVPMTIVACCLHGRSIPPWYWETDPVAAGRITVTTSFCQATPEVEPREEAGLGSPEQAASPRLPADSTHGFRSIDVFIGNVRAAAAAHGTGERTVARHEVLTDRRGTWHAQVRMRPSLLTLAALLVYPLARGPPPTGPPRPRCDARRSGRIVLLPGSLRGGAGATSSTWPRMSPSTSPTRAPSSATMHGAVCASTGQRSCSIRRFSTVRARRSRRWSRPARETRSRSSRRSRARRRRTR